MQLVLQNLEKIDIEISVLSPMQKISNVNTIRLGIDGIYIKKACRSGTFLPQVASETHWSLNFITAPVMYGRDRMGRMER
ncbi:MAG: AMMECR1 domain-containing protein [Bacteroidales bacterium]